MAGVEYVISLKDRFSGTLNKLNAQTKRLDTNMKSLNSSISGTSVAIVGMATAFAGFKAVSAAAELKSMAVAMEVVSGSAVEGAKSMDFAEKTADKLGLSLKASREGLKQLAGGFKGSGIEIDKVRKIFGQVSIASSAMQLSVERQKLVFNALSQIASKGVVSMEELRQQLGESLPGAMGIAAKSVGKGLPEFTKLVGSGKLMAQKFLPLFAKELEKTFSPSLFKSTKTFNSELTRMKNSFLQLKEQIGGVLIPILKPMVMWLSKAAGFLKENGTLVRRLTKVVLGLVVGMTALVVVTKAYAAVLAITAFLDPFRLMIISIAVLIGLMVVFRKNVAEALDVIDVGFREMGANIKNHFLGIIETVQLQWLNFAKTVNETLRNLDQVAKIEEKINGILEKNSKRGIELNELRKKQREAQLKFGEGIFGTTDKVKDTASEIAKGLGLSLGGGGEGDLSLSNQTTVTSAAPKVFNINIEKLVESFKVETTNMVEGAEKTKEAITAALLGALADVQTA